MGKKVDQAEYLAVIKREGTASLWWLRDWFGVSETTVRRNCDGLVYQGKITVTPGQTYPERARTYTYVRD